MTYKTQGIVIKRINVGEADKILTFYTANCGKIRAKAVSLRKTTSKLAGHLELFALTDLMLARGKTIDKIISAQTINSFLNIRKDLHKISYAYFICELLEKLVPEELKETRLFRLVVTTLEILNRPKFSLESCPLLLLGFEIRLLDLLGFAMQVSQCLNCGRKVEMKNKKNFSGIKLYFSAARGGILCAACKSEDPEALPCDLEEVNLINFLRNFSNYKRIGNLRVDQKVLFLLSQKIDYFVYFIFGKNLKSAKLILEVKRLERDKA